MEKNIMIKYAPTIIVIIAFIFQWNLFVTPEKLEQTHREILTEISDKYTTKEQFNDVKNQLSDMQKKIDKIYEKLIK